KTGTGPRPPVSLLACRIPDRKGDPFWRDKIWGIPTLGHAPLQSPKSRCHSGSSLSNAQRGGRPLTKASGRSRRAVRRRDTPFIPSGLSLPSALAIRKDMRRWRGGNGSSPGNQRRTVMETSRRTFLTTAAAMAATAATAPLSSAADKFARDRDSTGRTPITYPEPAWEVKDQRFTGMQGNATLQRIWHGMGNDRALWCEGPVWMGDWGSLIWSDIPNHRTLRWIEDDGHVSVFQTESGYSNGHTRDNQ